MSVEIAVSVSGKEIKNSEVTALALLTRSKGEKKEVVEWMFPKIVAWMQQVGDREGTVRGGGRYEGEKNIDSSISFVISFGRKEGGKGMGVDKRKEKESKAELFFFSG